jgi:hypothetical protein
MIQLKPYLSAKYPCSCGGVYDFSEFIWQGLHVCEKLICSTCNRLRINSLPVNQSELEQYTFYPETGLIYDINNNAASDNWFTVKLQSVANPVPDEVDIEIEIFKKFDEVLILNTLDYIYGHSLLFLFNLQRIIKTEKSFGVIVIVQPMMKWLIPKQGIAELWTVNLGFQKFDHFYQDLSDKINSQLTRFNKVWLSKGYVLPTNENIDIEKFTGIRPYDFINIPEYPRISYIWREDPDRLWIRNIYLLKGLKKLGFKRILIPFQYLRVLTLFKLLKNKFGNRFTYSVTGFGNFGKFPSFIDDQRVTFFNEEKEKLLCRIYAESVLVLGVHGSSMLLPSAHAGMSISLMPSKRWCNFAEDILFVEEDVRLASYQRRIIPLNICIFDICDIVVDMITGREFFIKKFIHNDEL